MLHWAKNRGRGWEEKAADQIFSEVSWQVGPMTFNPLCLDSVQQCFHMGIRLQIRGKRGLVPWALWEDRQPAPLSSHRASLQLLREAVSNLLLGIQGGHGMFFIMEFSLPSKRIFSEQAPPHSHHQPSSFNCKHRENCPPGRSPVSSPEASRGFCWEVRMVLLLVPLQLVAVTVLNKALTFVSWFAFNFGYLIRFSEEPCKAARVRVVMSILQVRKWRPN